MAPRPASRRRLPPVSSGLVWPRLPAGSPPVFPCAFCGPTILPAAIINTPASASASASDLQRSRTQEVPAEAAALHMAAQTIGQIITPANQAIYAPPRTAGLLAPSNKIPRRAWTLRHRQPRTQVGRVSRSGAHTRATVSAWSRQPRAIKPQLPFCPSELCGFEVCADAG